MESCFDLKVYNQLVDQFQTLKNLISLPVSSLSVM